MNILHTIQKHYLFALIILVAIILRFYQLGQVPISPDWDEVSLGYNAYSVLLTGHDEFGKFLPVIIQSFGDYKPALYMYLAIPSIAMFGLNVFATRLPGAVVGVLAVIATYYLADELFKKKSISLLSALFLAISPWSLQFSRLAIESSVGDAFNIFTALFFIKGLKKSIYLYFSAVFAALDLYVYQSEKGFTPLFVLLLIVIYHKQLFAVAKKTLIGVVLVGIVVTLPTLVFILSNHDALTRLASVNVFSDSFHTLQQNVKEEVQDHANHDILGEVIDNRRFVFLNKILANYTSHFDPNWWFIKGDFTDRHQAPQMGHLYLWDLPFLFIGLYCLFFTGFDKKTKYFLLGWFLLAPLPAAITNDVPHAVRTLNFLPTFQIFTAIGCVYTFLWVKDRFNLAIAKRYAYVCAVLLLCNIIFYLDHYFIQFNYFTSQDWQYGYTQIIPYVQQHENEYTKIVVDTHTPLDQSYIFFLFYLHYPPDLVQQVENGHTYTADHTFGKFVFHTVTSNELENIPNKTLYIIGANEYTGNGRVIKTVKFLDGTPAMDIVTNAL